MQTHDDVEEKPDHDERAKGDALAPWQFESQGAQFFSDFVGMPDKADADFFSISVPLAVLSNVILILLLALLVGTHCF